MGLGCAVISQVTVQWGLGEISAATVPGGTGLVPDLTEDTKPAGFRDAGRGFGRSQAIGPGRCWAVRRAGWARMYRGATWRAAEVVTCVTLHFAQGMGNSTYARFHVCKAGRLPGQGISRLPPKR